MANPLILAQYHPLGCAPCEQLAGPAWQGTEGWGRGSSGAPLDGAAEAISLDGFLFPELVL